MTDLHIHTRFSPDSEEPAENYIHAARAKGANVLGFSEHYDYDVILEGGTDWRLPDLQAYGSELSALQKKYPDIKILKGVELGYSGSAEERYREVLRSFNFDYAILSVHTLEGRGDCFFPAFFEGRSQRQAYEEYFHAVLQSVRSEIDYQIVGHLGYVARNAPYSERRILYREFSQIIDEILREIIEQDKSLEINTKADGTGECTVPGTEILERYLELGGTNFTFGSDAHCAQRFMERADVVKTFLLQRGITEINRYEACKKIKEKLL